jgi:hypothetical protein
VCVPSYFWAIIPDAMPTKVSGVTMVVQQLPSQHLVLAAAPMVIETLSPIAEFFAKHPVLLATVVNDLQLT